MWIRIYWLKDVSGTLKIKFTKFSTKSFREMQFASAPCSSRPITFFSCGLPH
jgi:hypothetical protein